MAKPQHSPRSWLRVASLVNHNHCVNSVTGHKDSVHVTVQGDLDLAPVIARNRKVTLNLNVDSCVANAHIVTGLPQRKGVNPTYCQMYTEIKYVKNVSCVGHLCSVNLVTNAQHAVIDPRVGARLHQCWEKWEALGSSPKLVTTLREGYTLPFRFRPNLTRSPTVMSNYHNSAKQSFLLEALYQLINKNAVEPVKNKKSLGFYNRLFLVPKPATFEHLFKQRVVQNGDPRDNKNLPTGRGVGHIHRLQRCILPYTNSQSVKEAHAFSRISSKRYPLDYPQLPWSSQWWQKRSSSWHFKGV